ncbi:sugar phosphate isomerase/epimerase [Halosimplex litoreum]|uniref:Sugar phosphate isomerase/epimerase n=1 Tax=Halosimplex litoreum TaxID=1198301 RepID=A0A7U3WAZ9_9EURY|nr:sugar phosphate isomerase/epimerase [Halosimplex litoreum]QPV64794.1 sugar phosphate isomerase/epimerase [Halosimplex litoreum]
MTRSAVQLYTLRNVDRPFTEVLELVADAGFDGVEFAYRVTEADTDAVLATLEETGLDVAGAHVGIDELEDDFEATVAYYDDLGVEHVVVPWLDAEHFESVEAVEAAAARLAKLADDLAERGMTLHYHNHDHEYTDLGEETGFDRFVDETEFGIELDLGLALAAGDDVVERLRDLGDRSRLVHLKDYDASAGESVPVGEGDLDLDGVADAVAANDSEWLIYEYEGADSLESLDRAGSRTNDLV